VPFKIDPHSAVERMHLGAAHLKIRDTPPRISGLRCLRCRSKSQSLEKKKEAVATIQSIALSLHSNGEYPSLKRVKKALNGPLGVVVSEAAAVLR
jgi:hypothetical protein